MRIVCPCGDDESFKFLPYQLSMVGYWPTMALTGNGELGFDSGEGARETATTSKEGISVARVQPRTSKGITDLLLPQTSLNLNVTKSL